MKKLVSSMLALVIMQPILIDAESTPKRAIVIGASSGIGRGVAKELARQGYILGLVARRLPLLKSLQEEISGTTYIKQIDVTEKHATQKLHDLIKEMSGLDVLVIGITSYGDALDGGAQVYDPEVHWSYQKRYLDVDAAGFIAMAETALGVFKKQRHGHLVGISSTSGLRGAAVSPLYCAAKACISRYMEGVRNFMIQRNIPVHVTDIIAGFVATERDPLGTDPNAYWEITTEEAAQVIVKGIKRQQKIVYVPGRAWLIAMLLRNLPDWFYNKYGAWL